METPLACMFTWTTYGSWLQGDRRGYVKDGKTLSGNRALRNANRGLLKKDPVFLSIEQRRLVEESIIKEASRTGHEILALAVCSDHVHLVLAVCDETAGTTVRRYKRASTHALRQDGFVGKVWTKVYDKRYCMGAREVRTRVAYVLRHNE